MSKHTPGRLYIRTNRHPNTDGTPWGWVDLYEPGSMRQASPEGIQVTWSRGQKSEDNARRLVACWNACEGISTESLVSAGNAFNGWRLASYAMDDAKAQRDELLEILERAVRRLEIAHANGDTIMREWIVDARAAIAKATGENK